jgi:hypothetical protein
MEDFLVPFWLQLCSILVIVRSILVIVRLWNTLRQRLSSHVKELKELKELKSTTRN